MKKEEPGEPKPSLSKQGLLTPEEEAKFLKTWYKPGNSKVGKTFVAFIKKQPPTKPS